MNDPALAVPAGYALPNPHPRPDWLARHAEPVLEPDLPIIDAHHHLWDVAHPRYLFDDLLADLGTGHNVVATVFIEAEAMARADGPEEMRPVGEVEFANGVAAMSASGLYGSTRVCAAIVGHADLGLGDRVEPVLDALQRAGGTRFRGVRHGFGRDPDVRMRWAKDLARDPRFIEGFRRLQSRGLTFDAWMYHPQLPDLVGLLEACPEAHVVVNHLGGRIAVGRHAAHQAEVTAGWAENLRSLAGFPNVRMKLGGLGMALAGHSFHDRAEPPSSTDLAVAWRPAIETCLEIFGPERCMFESNFPVDKASCSYLVLWNAFKRLSSGCSPEQRRALFHDTAAAFYRL